MFQWVLWHFWNPLYHRCSRRTSTQSLPSYAYKSSSSFCNVFTLLCPITKLPTMYYISITKYFTALHQIWCSYHNYVGEAIRFRILFHHSGPFGKSSNHSSCFFTRAKASFSGSTCCARLFRMLDFDHSYTSLSFPIGWSPYSFHAMAHV
jgi:hypothetical protein